MKKKLLKVLGNRILLIKDTIPEYKGNLYIPRKEALYAPPYSGVIISVGSKVMDTDLVEGVRISFHDLAGIEFEFDNQKILSIRENDVTAILEKNLIIE